MSSYDALAPVYADWSTDMTENVPFYVELAKETEGPLVELVFDPKIAASLDGTTQSQNGIVHTLHYHPGNSRIDIRYGETTISLFWIARAEWEGLIDVAGLKVEGLYGWFDRRPFADDSPEFVWITRKPE